MIDLQTTPIAVLIPNIFLFLTGIAFLFWGTKLPKSSTGILWFIHVALIAGLCFSWSQILEHQFQPMVWSRGWVWPRDESGAMKLGILLDSLGVALSLISVLISAALLLNSRSLEKEPRVERFFAASAIAVSGIVLSWISLTVWLSFFGIGLTLLGGFIGLGMRFGAEAEAIFASRWVSECFWGLVLSVIGACILAGCGSDLTLNQGAVWISGASSSVMETLGAAVLLLGVFILFQPFPFSGRVMTDESSALRLLSAQVFPSLAASAILIRLEPQFTVIHFFPDFGWIALGLAALSIGSAFFQLHWKRALSLWTSSLSMIGIAILAFSGPTPAVLWLIGTALGISVVVISSAAFKKEPTSAQAALKGKALCSRLSVLIGVASCVGVLGFGSAGGLVEWLTKFQDEPTIVAVFAFMIFLASFLGWRIFWLLKSQRVEELYPWYGILSPLFLGLLGLGVFWNGCLTGGALPLSMDTVLPSLSGTFFPTLGSVIKIDDAAQLLSFWIYLGSLLVGVLAGYWTTGRKVDTWASFSKSAPRFSNFMMQGYAAEAGLDHSITGLRAVGGALVSAIDGKFWNDWFPKGCENGIRIFSASYSKADSKIVSSVGKGLQKCFEVMAKFLQLIQSGDVQWYLLFALGSGVAILIHFLLS